MAVLLATLRPSGVLGDANDATYEAFMGSSETLLFSRVPLANYTAGGTVEYVVFKMRGEWTLEEQGPGTPDWVIEWYEGPLGAGLNAGPFAQEQTGTPTTWESPQQATDRQGQPWSQAVLNSPLEMRGFATVYDNGSQVLTTVLDLDVWAEVWGTPTPPEPEPEPARFPTCDTVADPLCMPHDAVVAFALDTVADALSIASVVLDPFALDTVAAPLVIRRQAQGGCP